jgi:hypothetical protein
VPQAFVAERLLSEADVLARIGAGSFAGSDRGRA